MEKEELENYLADLLEMRDAVISKISKLTDGNKDILAAPFERKIEDGRTIKAFFTGDDFLKRNPVFNVDARKMSFSKKSARVKATISWVQEDEPVRIFVDPLLKDKPAKLLELADRHLDKLNYGQKRIFYMFRKQHNENDKQLSPKQTKLLFNILTETIA